MPIGLGLGGAAILAGGQLAGGILGGYSQQKAAKEAGQLTEAQKAGARQYLQKNKGKDALYRKLEAARLIKANKAALGGFGAAQKALELGGVAARQTVRTEGAQQQAGLEQSLVSRGLIGTSTGAQQFAGLGSQTTQQLAAIDTQLAQQFADLGLQRSQVETEGELRLAGLAQRNRARQEELLYELANLAPQQGYSFSSGKGNFFDKLF